MLIFSKAFLLFCYTLKSMYIFFTKRVYTFRAYKYVNWDAALD